MVEPGIAAHLLVFQETAEMTVGDPVTAQNAHGRRQLEHMLPVKRHGDLQHAEQSLQRLPVSFVLKEDCQIAQRMQIAGLLLQHLVYTFLGFAEPSHIEIGQGQIIMRRLKVRGILDDLLQQGHGFRKFAPFQQHAGPVMLHHALAAANPVQRNGTAALVMQQLHQFLRFRHELPSVVFLQISDQ
ncbi:hypothetical protein D3C71_1588060 [compost metagenome]